MVPSCLFRFFLEETKLLLDKMLYYRVMIFHLEKLIYDCVFLDGQMRREVIQFLFIDRYNFVDP